MISVPFMSYKLSYKQLANLDEIRRDVTTFVQELDIPIFDIGEHISTYTSPLHETPVEYFLNFDTEEDYAFYLLKYAQGVHND